MGQERRARAARLPSGSNGMSNPRLGWSARPRCAILPAARASGRTGKRSDRIVRRQTPERHRAELSRRRPAGRPLLLFLHGFPEAAFVWDDLLERFAADFRCVAPNLRGFERSSAPVDVSLSREAPGRRYRRPSSRCWVALPRPLVAHDWGGAVAWAFAAQQARVPQAAGDHQFAASGDFPARAADQPGRSSRRVRTCVSSAGPTRRRCSAADDYARLWRFFTNMGAADPARPGGGWLTESLRDRYRAVWNCGLTGGCNYYRASPLRPPTAPTTR